MITISKKFAWSPNGYEVETVPAGAYETLPERAVAIAHELGLVEDTSGENECLKAQAEAKVQAAEEARLQAEAEQKAAEEARLQAEAEQKAAEEAKQEKQSKEKPKSTAQKKSSKKAQDK